MSTAAAPQTNGILPSAPSSQAAAASQPSGSQSQTLSAPTQSGASQLTTQASPAAAPASQPSQPAQQPQAAALLQQPNSPTSSAAVRPRDARTIELLLTAQGVTNYEERVPQCLLDFAYRHTSNILSDALHLAADPYVSQAGSKPSASSGVAPVNVGDAPVSANAVQLAIASRLAFQFRGGSGAGASSGGGGGSASKEWMQDLARERNRIALPRVAPNEWGLRLPSERFVLSGVSWGLKNALAGQEADESSEEEDMDEAMEGVQGRGADGEAMEGVETEDVGGDPVEGGTVDDIFGDDVDVEMEE